MKKLSLIRSISLLICAFMLISLLASCDNEKESGEETSEEVTEASETAGTTDREDDSGDTSESDAESGDTAADDTTSDETTSDETVDEVSAEDDTTEPEETTEGDTGDDETDEPEETTEEVTDCGGKHAYWQTNGDGHYRDACAFCGGGAVELKAHSFDMVGNTRKCTICGYSNWIIDAEGHIPTEEPEREKELHFFFDFVDGYYCYVCKYIPECRGIHDWVAGEEGHSQAECDQCGAEELPEEPHDSLIETADGNKYKYSCTKCSHVFFEKEIGEGVEAYISPYMLSNVRGQKLPATREDELRPSTYFSMGGRVFEMADGVPAFSFTMGAQHASAAQWLWIRNDPLAGGGSSHEKYYMDIGTSQYAVIKMRTNDPSQSVQMTFSTKGADGREMVSIPLNVTEAEAWATYIVDLAAVFPEKYALAAGESTYKIDDLYFHIQPFSTSTTLDFAYIAFVSGSWAELDGLIDEDVAVLMTSKTSNALVNVKDGGCVEHASDVFVDNGEYVAKCAVCGQIFKRYGVSSDAATGFMPETAFDPLTLNGFTADIGIKTDTDGTSYIRYENFVGTKTEAQSPWAGAEIIGSANPVKAGRYMVIKLRVGDNGLDQKQLKLYMSTEGTTLKDETQGLGLKVEEDGLWHTLVIDLSTRVGYNKGGEWASSFLSADDGSYTIKFMQIRIFSGVQYGKNDDGTNYSMPEADDYMDIAYVAFCDSLDDIPELIDGDTYELSVDGATNVLYNKDGSPAA